MGTEEPIIFPPFQLDAANQRRGLAIVDHAEAKGCALLSYRLRHPDQLVTKEELLEDCWPRGHGLHRPGYLS